METQKKKIPNKAILHSHIGKLFLVLFCIVLLGIVLFCKDIFRPIFAKFFPNYYNCVLCSTIPTAKYQDNQCLDMEHFGVYDMVYDTFSGHFKTEVSAETRIKGPIDPGEKGNFDKLKVYTDEWSWNSNFLKCYSHIRNEKLKEMIVLLEFSLWGEGDGSLWGEHEKKFSSYEFAKKRDSVYDNFKKCVKEEIKSNIKKTNNSDELEDFLLNVTTNCFDLQKENIIQYWGSMERFWDNLKKLKKKGLTVYKYGE